MSVKCFMLRATDRAWCYLRRYSDGSCSGNRSYHNGKVLFAVCNGFIKSEDDIWNSREELKSPDDDERWPTKCDHCDFVFRDEAPRQLFVDHIYVDDAGKEYSLRDLPAGAMWYADWMGAWAKGPDGHCLMVQTPGGQWCIDAQASNCTMKDDTGPFEQAHRCWVRHGTPPNITVDKNGRTCAAGAGSIQVGDYHGFLQNGCLT